VGDPRAQIADCSEVAIVPTCASFGLPGKGIGRDDVGTIRGCR